MSKEVLEKALSKTKELEERQLKRMKVAEAVGKVTGSVIALSLDALVVWAILNYLIGVSVGFLPTLGFVLLAMVILAKVKLAR